MKKKKNLFHQFAKHASLIVGNAWTFLIMFCLVIGWLCSGPFLHFSDHWQLIINTSTSVITFLVVFLIQNTQNRDSEYMKIMLDELILIHKKASNKLVNLDDLSDDDLQRLEEKFKKLSKQKADSKESEKTE